MFKRYCVGGMVAVFLALLFVGTAVTPAFAAPDESAVHIVRRGETLYGIALSYGVSTWAVVRANHIANPNTIYAGQRLVIP